MYWREELTALAVRLDCEPASVVALATVEVGQIPVMHGLPVIRFETHVMSRRTVEPVELEKVIRNVEGDWTAWDRRAQWYRGSAGWMPVHTGSQFSEWAALASASEVDPEAALESASWGVFQLMGYHWEEMGLPSVQAFVARNMRGPEVQIRLLGRYLRWAQDGAILEALQAKDWEQLTILYNGPGQVDYYRRALAIRYEEASRILEQD
jgi:hypothetical protein